MGEWQPIHDKHAIAVVAMVVTFSGELPQRIASKFQEKATDLASSLGLSNSAPIQGIAFDASKGVAAAAEHMGVVLSSVRDIPKIHGHPIDFSKQLHVDRSSIMYRTSVYSRWEEMRDDLDKLISPLITMVSDVISVQSIRLEYLDKFTFSGDLSDALTANLISTEFDMVAPHIFKNPDDWHSHVGLALRNEPGGYDKILHVNVDSNRLTQKGSPEARTMRTVNIMTAREDRKPFGGVENGEYSDDIVLERLDSMHGELKKMIKEILVQSMRDQIGLE